MRFGAMGARGGFGGMGTALGTVSSLPIPDGYTVDSDGYLVDGSNKKFIYLKFADGKYWLGADGNYLFGRAP